MGLWLRVWILIYGTFGALLVLAGLPTLGTSVFASLVVVLPGAYLVWRAYTKLRKPVSRDVPRTQEDARAVAERVFRRRLDEIVVLVMMARSDGRLSDKEREFIVAYLIGTEKAAVESSELDRLVAGVRSGEQKFRRAVDALSAALSDAEKTRVVRAVAGLLGKKLDDPISAGQYSYIRQRFNLPSA